MIGEIRDKETAEIAIKAAQTGHLVLSTLHTNDSAAAVTRLLDLGVPGFQIATSVTGIIAQRLVRRLCECHKVIAASPEYVSRFKGAGITNPPEMESTPVGCEIVRPDRIQGAHRHLRTARAERFHPLRHPLRRPQRRNSNARAGRMA